jgi:hypothetical protein
VYSFTAYFKVPVMRKESSSVQSEQKINPINY